MSAPHTIQRSKIGSHLSYPVKFSELCESLSPVMEQFGIGVFFTAFFPPRQNEVRDEYRIIEAAYDPHEESSWRLTISPIPRAIREEVRLLVLTALAEEVRSWLIAKHQTGWCSTCHALCGKFDVASKKLLFHEHNAA
jgi:hypothetical protein